MMSVGISLVMTYSQPGMFFRSPCKTCKHNNSKKKPKQPRNFNINYKKHLLYCQSSAEDHTFYCKSLDKTVHSLHFCLSPPTSAKSAIWVIYKTSNLWGELWGLWNVYDGEPRGNCARKSSRRKLISFIFGATLINCIHDLLMKV